MTGAAHVDGRDACRRPFTVNRAFAIAQDVLAG